MRGIYWLIGVVLLWAAGCSSSTHRANVHDHQNPYQSETRLQWNSSNLRSVLQVETADADRITGGLLRVRLVLRNKTKEDLFVDVRAVFTDEQGFEKEKTNWEPVCCTARTQTTYQVVSLGSQVNDFQIIIRDPKTSPEE